MKTTNNLQQKSIFFLLLASLGWQGCNLEGPHTLSMTGGGAKETKEEEEEGVCLEVVTGPAAEEVKVLLESISPEQRSKVRFEALTRLAARLYQEPRLAREEAVITEIMCAVSDPNHAEVYEEALGALAMATSVHPSLAQRENVVKAMMDDSVSIDTRPVVLQIFVNSLKKIERALDPLVVDEFKKVVSAKIDQRCNENVVLLAALEALGVALEKDPTLADEGMVKLLLKVLKSRFSYIEPTACGMLFKVVEINRHLRSSPGVEEALKGHGGA
ncbi:MAG: hypothetical protein AAFP00_17900 [Bacteroidota bacterium]